MAGTCNPIVPHVIGSTTTRNGTLFSVRMAMRSHGGVSAAATCNEEGPSCIFVGPIETASKETLEALYRQARDAYYSGEPLIVDDMFDRVEAVETAVLWLKICCQVSALQSKATVYLCRCRGQEDLSQVFALASIWILIFAFGSSICLVPIICTVGLAYQDAFGPSISYGSQANVSMFLASLNGILFTVLGSLIGYPVASSAVRVLQGLWRNDLVSLKGSCPNCGEEVFAFVKSDQSKDSPHRADCHVCESLLEFRTKVEQSSSRLGRQWVYGRIYLLSRRGRNRYWR